MIIKNLTIKNNMEESKIYIYHIISDGVLHGNHFKH